MENDNDEGLETPPDGQGSALFGTCLHIAHSPPLLWHSNNHGTTYTLRQSWESEEPSEWMCYSVNLAPCFLLVILVVTGFDFCTFTGYSLTCFYRCSDLLHFLLAVPICLGRVTPNFMWHFSSSWSNTRNFQRREKSKKLPSNKVKPQRKPLHRLIFAMFFCCTFLKSIVSKLIADMNVCSKQRPSYQNNCTASISTHLGEPFLPHFSSNSAKTVATWVPQHAQVLLKLLISNVYSFFFFVFFFPHYGTDSGAAACISEKAKVQSRLEHRVWRLD